MDNLKSILLSDSITKLDKFDQVLWDVLKKLGWSFGYPKNSLVTIRYFKKAGGLIEGEDFFDSVEHAIDYLK